jgi:hypothetical protein
MNYAMYKARMFVIASSFCLFLIFAGARSLPLAERAFSVGGSSLAANIRKRQIGLTVTNALSFYIAEFIAVVKGFMVPALEMMTLSLTAE